MARQESLNPIVGRIGDLVYYKRNGKYYVRKASSITRETVKKSARFSNTPKVNNEFSGCAKASHDFRQALDSLIHSHAEKGITSPMNGLFASLLKYGAGELGSRSIEISKNKMHLEHFSLTVGGISVQCSPHQSGFPVAKPGVM